MTRGPGLAGALVALGVLVAVLISQLLGDAGGPETALVTRLKLLERDGVSRALPYGELVTEAVQYQRISVVLDADAQGASVTSTLDLTGRLVRANGSKTRVSSLGLERARYRLRDGAWLPETSDLPRLLQIVDALERRRAALEVGAPSMDGGVAFAEVRPRTYSAEAWFIRSEREEVAVAEDSRLVGNSPSRPVDEKKTTRLTLQEDASGLFSFPDETM